MTLAIDLLTWLKRLMPRSSKAKQETWPGIKGFCRALNFAFIALSPGVLSVVSFRA